MGTHVLLESAKVAKISRFIHVSTDEVYGEQTLDQEAMSEEQVRGFFFSLFYRPLSLVLSSTSLSHSLSLSLSLSLYHTLLLPLTLYLSHTHFISLPLTGSRAH